jgi:hypothetical protein
MKFKSTLAGSTNCSQCHRPKVGTHHCDDCQLHFCSVHAAAHEVDHETHRLSVAVSAASAAAVAPPRRAQCATHDKDFEAYCNTCRVPVCVSCTIFSHRGADHDLIELKKARQTALDAVLTVLPGAEKRVQTLVEMISNYKQVR